ncbi:MAG: tRNA threonylcarbamoyladenosine dehydratase, partial [Gemmiger qucibialis]
CHTHCICPPDTARKCTQRRQVPGSNACVPAAAGLIIAGEVVRDIANGEPQKK